jgi:hypothetical protein
VPRTAGESPREGCNLPDVLWGVEFLRRIAEGEDIKLKDSVLVIKGTANLRQALLLTIKDDERAAFFEYEEDKMYSKRESEPIQKYLQKHGEMPGGGDLDDLF